MYEIRIRKKVDRFIDTLQNSSRIKSKLQDLRYFKTRNVRLDIERYKGEGRNLYRLRIGDIRFIFQVMDS
jgi:mRNA-degrading endonuclease RelE of RelBE toxin-antitoxin system